MKFSSRSVAVIVASVALAAIPQLSIPPGFIVSGGDGSSPELNPDIAWQHLWPTWQWAAGLGFDGSSTRPVLFPFVLVALVLRHLGLSPELICRLWYSLLVVVQAAGMGWLLILLFGQTLRIQYLVLTQLFVIVNPYMLISLHGPYLTTQLSVATMPAVVASAIGFLKRANVATLLTYVAVLSIAATGDANPSIFVAEAMLLTGLAVLWFKPERAESLAILAVAFLSVNVIWIVPSYEALHHALGFLAAQSATYSDDTLRVVSQFSGLPHSARLIGEYLFFNDVAGEPYLQDGKAYDHDIARLLSSWVAPLLALAGFALAIYRRDLLPIKIGAVALCALFFAKGASPPFEGVFLFLYTHVVAFQGFRDSFGKFEWVVLYGFAILIAYLFVTMDSRWPVWTSAGAFIFVAATVVAGNPMLSGGLFWPHVIVRVPQRYYELSDLLNRQRLQSPLVEMPIAPAIFDAYRWGYIGAGINSQLIRRPLLAGQFRLLSPANETIADSLETTEAIGARSLVPWLGLYGFGGIIADDALSPALFTPSRPSSRVPPGITNARITWRRRGLTLYAFDRQVVNTPMYVPSTVVTGADGPTEVAAVCAVLATCRDVAFLDRNVGLANGRAAVVRRHGLFTQIAVPPAIPDHRGSAARIETYVDDAEGTEDVTGSRAPTLHRVVYGSYPVTIRIGDRDHEVLTDATVDGNAVRARVLCQRPDSSQEFDLAPRSKAGGRGLLALTYENEAAAHLLLTSAAGSSETLLATGTRSSVVRVLAFSKGTRVRLVLEPRSGPGCLFIQYLSFSSVRLGSPLARGSGPLHVSITPYQSVNDNPLESFERASRWTLTACPGKCSGEPRSVSRSVPIRPLLVGEPQGLAQPSCSRKRDVIFRADSIRLIPGLRYRLREVLTSTGEIKARAAVLSEDEFGIVGAPVTTVRSGQAYEFSFTVPIGIHNVLIYTWASTLDAEPTTCIDSASLTELSAPASFAVSMFQMDVPRWHFRSSSDSAQYFVDIANGRSNGPVVIVLNQTFDDRWQFAGGSRAHARQVAANGHMNGWLLTHRGNMSAVISYTGDRVSRWSGFLGVAGMLLSVVWIRFRRIDGPLTP